MGIANARRIPTSLQHLQPHLLVSDRRDTTCSWNRSGGTSQTSIFRVLFSRALQTVRGSRICTATIDCMRCTCVENPLERRTTSGRKAVLTIPSCYPAHAHTPFPPPASGKHQLDEVVSAASAASDPAGCGVWGNTRHRSRRRLNCARGRSYQQRCPYYQRSHSRAINPL